MRRLLVLAAPALLSFACPEAPPPDNTEDQRVNIPDAPAESDGFQLVGPEITIPAGGDKMWCWVPEFTPTQDKLIKEFQTFQGASGHHLLAMRSVIPRQPGELFDCTTQEGMVSIEPLISPNSQNKEGTVNLLSDDFAIRLPANTQIVMQSHYVNTRPNPIIIRDAANFIYLPPDEQRIEAQYLVVNDGELAIPANNEHYTHTTDCVIEQDELQFAAMTGHMHEWGKHITIEAIPASGAASTIYDVPDWTAKFRDAPPVTHLPLAEPVVLHHGDTLRVTCDWLNDTDDTLRFPNEMCDAVFVYYPALPEGFLLCGT